MPTMHETERIRQLEIVDSAPKVGSTFQVSLPIHNSGRSELSESRPKVTQPQVRGTILVIDDEPDVRTVAQLMLHRMGLHVFAAADAATALNLLHMQATNVHLFLIDVTMPAMAGPELARAILALQPTARFIVMSGHSEQEALAGFPDGAVAAFLAKPFTFAELAAQVQAVMHQA